MFSEYVAVPSTTGRLIMQLLSPEKIVIFIIIIVIIIITTTPWWDRELEGVLGKYTGIFFVVSTSCFALWGLVVSWEYIFLIFSTYFTFFLKIVTSFYAFTIFHHYHNHFIALVVSLLQCIVWCIAHLCSVGICWSDLFVRQKEIMADMFNCAYLFQLMRFFTILRHQHKINNCRGQKWLAMIDELLCVAVLYRVGGRRVSIVASCVGITLGQLTNLAF